MNIATQLNFNPEKPAILVIQKTEKINIIAVGLLKKQVLAKHKTGVPTLLTLLKGSLEFKIDNDVIILKCYDTYEIPVHILHEVIGLDTENIFTLTQEK